jgi:hypothetical protein
MKMRSWRTKTGDVLIERPEGDGFELLSGGQVVKRYQPSELIDGLWTYSTTYQIVDDRLEDRCRAQPNGGDPDESGSVLLDGLVPIPD